MAPKSSDNEVRESAINDVFEGRHPAPAEQQWAERTLAPLLEKSPDEPRHRELLTRCEAAMGIAQVPPQNEEEAAAPRSLFGRLFRRGSPPE